MSFEPNPADVDYIYEIHAAHASEKEKKMSGEESSTAYTEMQYIQRRVPDKERVHAWLRAMMEVVELLPSAQEQ